MSAYRLLAPQLNERQRRLFAAAEARSSGVAGSRRRRGRRGWRRTRSARGSASLRSAAAGAGAGAAAGRRAQAGGRGRSEAARGSASGWWRPTPAAIPSASAVDVKERAQARRRAGRARDTGQLPDRRAAAARSLGYSLQANAQDAWRAPQHPDRDAQFEHINATVGGGDRRRAAGDQHRHQEEGAGRRVQERRSRVAPSRPAPIEVNTLRLPEQAAGQGDPLRRLRHRRRRGLVSVGIDHDTAQFAVAAIRAWWQQLGPSATPTPRRLIDHRRLRRLKRQPHPAVEDRAAAPGRRHRPCDQRLPLPARHQQVEQDRAPPVQLHHHELARQAADQPTRRSST